MKEFSVLNSRVSRVDAVEKATGKAIYTDDMNIKGMLYGAILHSPLAHARIKRIDTSRALALSGVHAVVTHREAGTISYGVSPARHDETIFCYDRVRYVGDEIAAVAADDPVIAHEAVQLIDVEYEELPLVLDGEHAMDEGMPQLHEMYERNKCGEVHWNFGDVDSAEKEADYMRTDYMESAMQNGAFIEPQSVIAEVDHKGFLTMWSATQAPHYVQRTIAMALGLPLHKVRVIMPYVGGGFGPKASCSTLELATCLLALKTGRPVKSTFDREQVFLHARARHAFYHTIKTGVKKDGTILSLRHHCLLDGGAYASFGIATIYYAGSLLGGPYHLANMKYDGYRVVTNKPACGAQRGHGAVIARALFEVQLDKIAKDLGIDPVEMRLKNVMKRGDTTINELNMSSLGMRECLEAVRDSSLWKEKRANKKEGVGIGAACGFFVSGAGYPIYRSRTYHASVITKINDIGGQVSVYSGAAEIGQGSNTVLAMITAEALGIPLSDVKVHTGDTDLTVDLGAYSSRTTLMMGHAAKEAAENVRDQVLAVIAEKVAVEKEELTISNGEIVCLSETTINFKTLREEYLKEHVGFTDHPTGERLTFREASRIAFLEKGSIVGTGKYKPPKLGGSFKGATVGTSPAFGCSAQIAEVKVDMETGEVTVSKVTGAHDCGFAINRTSVEGQMQGSISMGLGEALMEEVQFDNNGRILNSNLAEYKIPTSMDMPDLEAIIIESDEPNGPYGAKEVGEGAIMPTIPAILNAIYDATGVYVEELPVTPERVLRAIREKQ